MNPRKFILLHDRFEHKAGTTVYSCLRADYGCASDDSHATGEEHTTVTLDPTGDYPFITVPRTWLREVPA